MVSVTIRSLTTRSLSGLEREYGPDTPSSRPCRSPLRDGGVICFDHLNDE